MLREVPNQDIDNGTDDTYDDENGAFAWLGFVSLQSFEISLLLTVPHPCDDFFCFRAFQIWDAQFLLISRRVNEDGQIR